MSADEVALATTTLMSEQEARTCVDTIRRGMENVRRSVYELYQRKGWLALGYSSWRDCVVAEFGQSKSQLYRELDAARIEANLQRDNVSPIGEIGAIPEGQLRPLAALPAEQQREVWERAVETAPDGKLTGAHVAATAAAVLDRDPVTAQRVDVTIFSSKSDEYYTPAEYIAAVVDVLGGIDLDPASCELAQATIKAKRYYTKADDGLAQPWEGRVYLNPPYGTTGGESNQGIWAQRLAEAYTSGAVTGAVLLVKAALGYEWFEALWYRWPVCFPRRRLSFGMPDGSGDGQSKQGSALFYFGREPERFEERFRQFGRVIWPEVL